MPYSTRLVAAVLDAALDDAYTVPAGFVAVIRDMELTNQGGTATAIAIDLEVPGPLTATIYFNADVPAGSWLQWQGRVVMNAGDVLSISASAYPIGAVVSGYLLSAP